MPWDFALILIFLGVAVPWLGRRRIRQLMAAPQTTKIDRLTLYASTVAFQWCIAALIFWRASSRGLTPAQLGVAGRNPILVVAVSTGLAALVLANQLVSLRRLASRPSEIGGAVPELALKIFPQDFQERLAFFVLVATVALCEEFIYRGFVQHVFESSSGGWLTAGVVGSACLFGLAHLYQGRRGLVSTFAIGLVFSTTRLATASLGPGILAHFIADLTAGFLAPGAVRKALNSAKAGHQAPNIDRDRMC